MHSFIMIFVQVFVFAKEHESSAVCCVCVYILYIHNTAIVLYTCTQQNFQTLLEKQDFNYMVRKYSLWIDGLDWSSYHMDYILFTPSHHPPGFADYIVLLPLTTNGLRKLLDLRRENVHDLCDCKAGVGTGLIKCKPNRREGDGRFTRLLDMNLALLWHSLVSWLQNSPGPDMPQRQQHKQGQLMGSIPRIKKLQDPVQHCRYSLRNSEPWLLILYIKPITLALACNKC